MEHKLTLSYIVQNLGVVIGLVLIWRGVWHILDGVDKYLLDGNTMITAFGGVIIGLIVLYLPDRDLKEIQKL
ncbi:MAG: hypothetical protein PHH40_01435 [Candidatus Moranbacteria bacterium]|nr:hypothetical protein [Candidatus Moranbacteria bacterium]MDD3965118.1 hypothetical protein [Candidatus Moranbacteria bacterium]